MVSTRGHFSLLTGKPSSLPKMHAYDCYHVPEFNRNSYPPNKDLVIYIHGVWTKQASSKEQVDRTNLSLIANGYRKPIMGFIWESNTSFNPVRLGVLLNLQQAKMG